MHVSTESRVEHEKRNQTATSLWSVGFVFFCSTGFSLSIEVSPLEYDVFSECALRCPGYFLYKTIATSHAVEDSTYVTGYQFAIYHNILFRLTLSYKIDWDSQNNVVDFSQSENLMGALRLTTL